MKGRKYEVTGFGSDHGCLDRFKITHFADEDNVRVLTKRSAQGLGKIPGIYVDLTLRDKGFLILVKKFDRVFDRDNVAVPTLVYVVYDR